MSALENVEKNLANSLVNVEQNLSGSLVNVEQNLTSSLVNVEHSLSKSMDKQTEYLLNLVNKINSFSGSAPLNPSRPLKKVDKGILMVKNGFQLSNSYVEKELKNNLDFITRLTALYSVNATRITNYISLENYATSRGPSFDGKHYGIIQDLNSPTGLVPLTNHENSGGINDPGPWMYSDISTFDSYEFMIQIYTTVLASDYSLAWLANQGASKCSSTMFASEFDQAGLKELITWATECSTTGCTFDPTTYNPSEPPNQEAYNKMKNFPLLIFTFDTVINSVKDFSELSVDNFIIAQKLALIFCTSSAPSDTGCTNCDTLAFNSDSTGLLGTTDIALNFYRYASELEVTLYKEFANGIVLRSAPPPFTFIAVGSEPNGDGTYKLMVVEGLRNRQGTSLEEMFIYNTLYAPKCKSNTGNYAAMYGSYSYSAAEAYGSLLVKCLLGFPVNDAFEGVNKPVDKELIAKCCADNLAGVFWSYDGGTTPAAITFNVNGNSKNFNSKTEFLENSLSGDLATQENYTNAFSIMLGQFSGSLGAVGGNGLSNKTNEGWTFIMQNLLLEIEATYLTTLVSNNYPRNLPNPNTDSTSWNNYLKLPTKLIDYLNAP